MGIKLAKKVLTFALVCMIIISPSVYAKDAISMEIVGVDEYMPELTAYVNLYDENGIKIGDVDHESITAALDGAPLEIIDIKNLKDTELSSATIFLIDISKSLETENFNEIKKNMISWVNSMSGEDAASIVTFGSDVNTVREFTQDKNTLIADIESLELTDYETSFYEAMQTAMNMASVQSDNIPYLRQIVVITDGINVLTGSITKNEIIKSIEDNPYIIYGIGAYGWYLTAEKQKSLDVLGEFARTSGGKYYQKELYEFDEMFALIQEDIDATQVVALHCENTSADGNLHNLYIAYEKDGKKLDDDIDVRLVEFMPDTAAPIMTDFKVLSENELEVYFSESVLGADEKANYEIKDASGQIVIPNEIVYSERDNEYKSNLKFIVDFDGSYNVKISGISDASGNVMLETTEMFEVVIEEEVSFFNEYKLFIYIAGALILIAAILIAIFLINRKKKEDNRKQGLAHSGGKQSGGATQYQPPSSLENTVKKNNVQKTNVVKSGPSKSVHLVVIDNKNDVSEMDIVVQGSLVIGRSPDCDVTFSDGEMSRQHCKISYENGQMYAEDLKATNTTIVNGIPLTARTRLQNGDSLLVGQTEIKISWKED